MHIAVIGAGTAGLCAARHAMQRGYDVTVFEQTAQVGGTWVYTDTVGKDSYGLDVHSSMYQGLRYVMYGGSICIIWVIEIMIT